MVLKAHGFHLRFITTAAKLFRRQKDPLPLMEWSGVYRLLCSNCLATHIRETGWKLCTRIQEHIDRAKFTMTHSRSQYSGTSSLRLGQSYLLHFEGSWRKRVGLEEIETMNLMSCIDSWQPTFLPKKYCSQFIEMIQPNFHDFSCVFASEKIRIVYTDCSLTLLLYYGRDFGQKFYFKFLMHYRDYFPQLK